MALATPVPVKNRANLGSVATLFGMFPVVADRAQRLEVRQVVHATFASGDDVIGDQPTAVATSWHRAVRVRAAVAVALLAGGSEFAPLGRLVEPGALVSA